ncbi:MAG TPA: nitroreductase family protein [Enhygromyxa sp.]|nr:nitroreductase family protein [Enhygromyxa sp.]
MSDRVRPSPWLSLAWEPAPEGSLALTLRAPPRRGRERVASHEAWLVELLDHLGGTPGSWSFAEIAGIARARGHAEADADIEATLARVWPLAFVRADASELDEHALLWERRGWKLALHYLIASAGDPSAHDPAASRRPPAASSEPGRQSADLRPLPSPNELPERPLEAILQRRRTCREFAGTPVELLTLASLLAHATGSAALPEQVFLHLLVMRVTGLEPGVYRYSPCDHAIALVSRASDEQVEAQLVRTLIGQPYARGAAVALLLSARVEALVATRPTDAALRGCLVEIGMLAQRLLLSGHAIELDSFLSAAILEHEARTLTMGDIDASMSPMHLVAFGAAAITPCERTGSGDRAPAACTG